MYYVFPSHFCLNTCSAEDDYAHARTVDTRLFLFLPTKILGTRLVIDGTGLHANEAMCKLYHLILQDNLPLQNGTGEGYFHLQHKYPPNISIISVDSDLYSELQVLNCAPMRLPSVVPDQCT